MSNTQHNLIKIDDNQSKCDEEREDDGDGVNARNRNNVKSSLEDAARGWEEKVDAFAITVSSDEVNDILKDVLRNEMKKEICVLKKFNVYGEICSQQQRLKKAFVQLLFWVIVAIVCRYWLQKAHFGEEYKYTKRDRCFADCLL